MHCLKAYITGKGSAQEKKSVRHLHVRHFLFIFNKRGDGPMTRKRTKENVEKQIET